MLQPIPPLPETYLDKPFLLKMSQTASEVFSKHAHMQLPPVKKQEFKMSRKDIPTFDLGVKVPLKRAELYNEYLDHKIAK